MTTESHTPGSRGLPTPRLQNQPEIRVGLGDRRRADARRTAGSAGCRPARPGRGGRVPEPDSPRMPGNRVGAHVESNAADRRHGTASADEGGLKGTDGGDRASDPCPHPSGAPLLTWGFSPGSRAAGTRPARWRAEPPSRRSRGTAPLHAPSLRSGTMAGRDETRGSAPSRPRRTGFARRNPSHGTSTPNRGAYCCEPNTSCSPGEPDGRSRLIVNLIALAGSNTTKSVMRSRGIR